VRELKSVPTRAPIEANETETEVIEEIHENPEDNILDEVPALAPARKEVELMGSELAELRLRNDLVDKAVKEAQEAQEAATYRVRVAQLMQNELTLTIRGLIRKNGLSEDYPYRADLERGKLVLVES
jgi:hypothetical protein